MHCQNMKLQLIRGLIRIALSAWLFAAFSESAVADQLVGLRKETVLTANDNGVESVRSEVQAIVEELRLMLDVNGNLVAPNAVEVRVSASKELAIPYGVSYELNNPTDSQAYAIVRSINTYLILRAQGHSAKFAKLAADNAPDVIEPRKDGVDFPGIEKLYGKQVLDFELVRPTFIPSLPTLEHESNVTILRDGELAWAYVFREADKRAILYCRTLDAREVDGENATRIQKVGNDLWKKLTDDYKPNPPRVTEYWEILQKLLEAQRIQWKSPVVLNPSLIFD